MSALIGKNIFSLGASRIISGVILFFVYVRAITYLGPDDFGKFSLVLAYYTIFLLLVDFGISKYVIKKVSEDKSRGSLYLGNFVTAQFFLGLGILILFLIIPKVLHYDQVVTDAMLIAGAALFAMAISLPYSAIVQAWQRIGVVAGVNFANTLMNALWLGLAIFFHRGIVFIFLLYILIGLVDIVLYAIYARPLAGLKPSFDKTVLKSLFVFGAPFALISGFEIIIQKIDVLIQKHFLVYGEVGLYSGAYRFVDFLTFIPAVVAISLFPFIAERQNLKTPEVKNMFDHVIRYMIAIGLPLGVGATLVADRIILTLFDERFLGSVVPFRILVWSSALMLFYAVPNVIMLVKRTRPALYTLAAAAALNAIANWFAIPRYGIVGSAWITVGTYAFVAAIYIYLSRRESDFNFFRYFGIPLFAVALMGSVIYYLRGLDIFSITGISLVIYFGTLFTVGFIKREDVVFVKKIFKREPA